MKFPSRIIKNVTRLFLVTVCAAPLTDAQTRLFNIPTTDIMQKGATYLEGDFDAHFAKSAEERWSSYGMLGVRGINDRVEVGMNAFAVRTADGFEPVELQPNVKFKIIESESKGIAFSTGAIAYLSLSKRFRDDASLSVYAVASKEFKSERAPRITAGVYQMIGANPDSGASRGFLVGLEQPVTKRLTFIADWNTGKNDLGYAAAGFGLAVTKRSSLYAAYYFGNEGRGNNSLGVYYSMTF